MKKNLIALSVILLSQITFTAAAGESVKAPVKSNAELEVIAQNVTGMDTQTIQVRLNQLQEQVVKNPSDEKIMREYMTLVGQVNEVSLEYAKAYGTPQVQTEQEMDQLDELL